MMKSLSPKLVVIGLVAVLALVAVALAIDTPSNTRSLDIVALVHEIQDGNVAKIDIARDGRSARVVFVDESTAPARVTIPNESSLPEILSQADVPFDAWPPMPVVQQSVTSRYSNVARS
jgi:hypothetical protein